MRREAVEAAVGRVGRPFRADDGRPPESDSAAHRRWWLRGEHGWLRCALRLSPEPVPLIQALAVTAVVDPSAALVVAGEALVGAAGTGGWPAGLEAGPAVDRAVVARGLAVVAAWLGAVELGALVAGDGTTTATWELVAPGTGSPFGSGRARLAVTLDAATRELTAVAVEAASSSAPSEGW